LKALVAKAPLIGFECRPVLEDRLFSVGIWTEQQSVDLSGRNFIVICPTHGDLTTARNRLGSGAREALGIGGSGLWIESVPTLCASPPAFSPVESPSPARLRRDLSRNYVWTGEVNKWMPGAQQPDWGEASEAAEAGTTQKSRDSSLRSE
jgi:hypothetical protein